MTGVQVLIHHTCVAGRECPADTILTGHADIDSFKKERAVGHVFSKGPIKLVIFPASRSFLNELFNFLDRLEVLRKSRKTFKNLFHCLFGNGRLRRIIEILRR